MHKDIIIDNNTFTPHTISVYTSLHIALHTEISMSLSTHSGLCCNIVKIVTAPSLVIGLLASYNVTKWCLYNAQ